MNKKNNHILMLSSWYPSRVNPTLGNFNEKFAEAAALYNEVTAVHVVADASMKTNSEVVRKDISGVDTIIYYFRKSKHENFINKILKALMFFKYYRKAYKKISEEKGVPHIVHLNILYPVGLIALFLKKVYGIPYVVSENWTGYLPSNQVKRPFTTRYLTRKIASGSSALLPVSEDLKKSMIKHRFTAPYHIVHNVTDTKHFNTPADKKKKTKTQILHVSSLKDDHKNISGILNVIRKLSQKRDDFELHIVGDGDATPHKHYAHKLGILNSYVKFFGTMLPVEIAQKMKASDFFVLFSNYENLPCVVIEAMAAGLPVISSTAGGVPEHLTHDKGILVKPRDEKALYDACLYMLDNFLNYDKEALHIYAKENFSYQSVGQKLTRIYDTYKK